MADFSLQDVLAEIDRQAPQIGVDAKMMKALAIAENTGSGSMKGKTTYSGSAVSPVGAQGIMQVMPDTAAGLQKAGFLPASWKYNPEDLPSQIQAGLAAAKEMSGRMKDPTDINELGAMYNGGNAGHRAYKSGNLAALAPETQQYLKKLGVATMELGGNNPSAFTASGSPASSSASRSSSSTSTTRNQMDPGLLSSYLNEVTGMVMPGGAFENTAEGLAKASADRQVANAALLDAITSAGAAEGQKVQAVATLSAAGAAKRQAILTRMNLDPAATDGEMDRALSTINSTDAKLQQLKPEIDARMSVGFFDNPLQWLVNQTRLPGMVAEYNGVVSTQNDSISRFKNLSGIAATQQSLSANTEADQILAAGQAGAAATAAQAQKDLAAAKIQNSSANAMDALRELQLRQQAVQVKGAAVAMTKQSITERESEREAAAQTAKEQLEIDNVNKIILAAGGSAITPGQYKGLPAAVKEKLLSNATSAKFGKDFSESFEFIRNNGNAAVMAKSGSAAVIPWMQGTLADVGKDLENRAKEAKARGATFKGDKELPAALDAKAAIYGEEGRTDMRTASANNPMKIDYKVAASLPALENNSLAIWLKKYGPGGTEQTMETVDENRIIAKFSQAIREGTMTPAHAVQQITQFYPVASANQAASTRYEMFGLDKPVKTYAVRVKVGVDTVSIDLGNPSQVENALVRKAAYDSAVESTRGFQGFSQLPPTSN